jgi:hypothetical protein
LVFQILKSAPLFPITTPRCHRAQNTDIPTKTKTTTPTKKNNNNNHLLKKNKKSTQQVVRIVRVARAMEALTPQQSGAREDPQLRQEIQLHREMSERFGVPPTVQEVRKMTAAERAAKDMEAMKAMMARQTQSSGGGKGGHVIGVGSSGRRGRRTSSTGSHKSGGRRRASSATPKTEAELKAMAAKAYAATAQVEAARVEKDTPEPHAYYLVEAFMAYSGEGDGELALTTATQLCQIKLSPNNWCYGFRLASKIGNFPSNYVERIDTGNPLLPVYARVLFDYSDTSDPNTLALKEGDVLAVFDDNNGEDGWWIGAQVGQTGLWPKNFVQKMQLDFGAEN